MRILHAQKGLEMQILLIGCLVGILLALVAEARVQYQAYKTEKEERLRREVSRAMFRQYTWEKYNGYRR